MITGCRGLTSGSIIVLSRLITYAHKEGEMASAEEVTPALYSMKGACEYLSISRTTLYELFRAGLPSVHQGSSRFIKRVDLDNYIASLGGAEVVSAGATPSQ